jgi:glycosyltransferase involved in cell wall biosynthesis
LIRTGVDLQRFDPARFDRERVRGEWGIPAEERIIMFVGHLIERKRPLLLTAIDGELQRISGFPQYRFFVVGDGPELPKLERYARAGGARKRFQFLGQREDIPALLAIADVLVAPSESEGTPLVISEALAMKTPVVAARVGAVDEILTDACGVLLDPDAPARAFAQVLASLFSVEAARQGMGEAGREFVQRQHDSAQVQREYKTLIEGLLAEDGPLRGRLGRPSPGSEQKASKHARSSQYRFTKQQQMEEGQQIVALTAEAQLPDQSAR